MQGLVTFRVQTILIITYHITDTGTLLGEGQSAAFSQIVLATDISVHPYLQDKIVPNYKKHICAHETYLEIWVAGAEADQHPSKAYFQYLAGLLPQYSSCDVAL